LVAACTVLMDAVIRVDRCRWSSRGFTMWARAVVVHDAADSTWCRVGS
jgi:hypothetical protein